MTQQKKTEDALWPLLLFFAILAFVLWGVFAAQPAKLVSQNPTATTAVVAIEPTAQPVIPTETPLPPEPTPQAVARPARSGEQIYQTTCAACHGFSAQGISGLGKPLVGTSFIAETSDEELVAFIIKGREVRDPLNTTGVAMPSRGGNISLTDAELQAVVTYIRDLNSTVSVPRARPTPITTTSIAEAPPPFTIPDVNALDPNVVKPSAGGSGSLSLALPDAEAAYLWSCAGCHGLDGQGIFPYGTDLTSLSLNAETIIDLFSNTDSLNTAQGEFSHPYLGGYPELTETQLREIIAYLETLNN